MFQVLKGELGIRDFELDWGFPEYGSKEYSDANYVFLSRLKELLKPYFYIPLVCMKPLLLLNCNSFNINFAEK